MLLTGNTGIMKLTKAHIIGESLQENSKYTRRATLQANIEQKNNFDKCVIVFD
jgi:Holliday junction resolvasome RuvABC ATP-dependent DNA helicase subunit